MLPSGLGDVLMGYVYDILEVYRIIIDKIDPKEMAEAVNEILAMHPADYARKGKIGDHIETMPIEDQIEAILHAYDGKWPEMQPIYYSEITLDEETDTKVLKMRSKWFRIIEKNKKA